MNIQKINGAKLRLAFLSILLTGFCLSSAAADFDASKLRTHSGDYFFTLNPDKAKEGTLYTANTYYPTTSKSNYDYYVYGSNIGPSTSTVKVNGDDKYCVQLYKEGPNSDGTGTNNTRAFAFKVMANNDITLKVYYRSDKSGISIKTGTGSYESATTIFFDSETEGVNTASIVTSVDDKNKTKVATYEFRPTVETIIWISGTTSHTQSAQVGFISISMPEIYNADVVRTAMNVSWRVEDQITALGSGYLPGDGFIKNGDMKVQFIAGEDEYINHAHTVYTNLDAAHVSEQDFVTLATNRNRWKTIPWNNQNGQAFKTAEIVSGSEKTYKVRAYFSGPTDAGMQINTKKRADDSQESFSGSYMLTGAQAMGAGMDVSRVLNWTMTPYSEGSYWITGANSKDVYYAGFDIEYNYDASHENALKGISAFNLLPISLDVTWTPSSDTPSDNFIKDQSNNVQYIYGASTVENGALKMTTNNAQGFCLGSNMTYIIKLTFSGDPKSGLQLIRADKYSDSAYTIVASKKSEANNAVTTLEVEVKTGNTNEIFWVAGISPTAANYTKLEIDYNPYDGILRPISTYRLWRATESEWRLPGTESGMYLDDNYIRYNGTTNGAVKTPETTAMKVLGVSTPTYSLSNAQDYLGIKTAAGKGKIKVYYTGKSEARGATEDLGKLNPWAGANRAELDEDGYSITFNSSGQQTGWNWGNKDFSAYTDVEIEFENVSDALTLGLWVQYNAGFDNLGNKTYTTGAPSDITVTHDRDNDKCTITYKLDPIRKGFIAQLLISAASGSGSAKVTSAKLVNKNTAGSASISLYSGGDNKVVGTTLIDQNPRSGSAPTNPISVSLVDGTSVMEYDFVNSTETNYWITGDMNIAAIEVLYDANLHSSDIIWWYVNPDCKMIAGSEYDIPDGFDEAATFYVSKGRKAKFAFFMPYTLDCLYAGNNDCSYSNPRLDSRATLGSNPCWVEIQNGGINSKRYYPQMFDSNGKFIKIGSSSSQKSDVFTWIGEEDISPATNADGSIKTGVTEREFWIKAHKGTATRNVYLRFIYLDPPALSSTGGTLSGTTFTSNDSGSNVTIENDDKKDDIVTYYYNDATVAQISIEKGFGTDGTQSNKPIYYTTSSVDPVDLTLSTLSQEQRYTTKEYNATDKPLLKFNGIVSAAQFIETEKPFYTDGIGSETSNSFKLISEDLLINLKDSKNLIYVKKPGDGFKSSLTNDGRFSNDNEPGDSVPQANNIHRLMNDDANKVLMTFLYGTNYVHYFYKNNSTSSSFRRGGVTWDASGSAQDWAYDTFIDAFKYHLDGRNSIIYDNDSPYKGENNANPYTEMNGGIGGKKTEDGGMFLQPVSGDFFRLEPEYDGVATLWVRQNGSSDDSNITNGQITRRPVYVMDENGRIMRATTIKPSAEHHLGINGVYAVNSGRSQYRYDFELSWKYGVYGAAGWNKPDWNDTKATHDTYVVYGFKFPNLPELGSDLAGKTTVDAGLALGKKYDVNRFSYTDPYPLYHDDWFAGEEEKMQLEGGHLFAKYGFEVPNYTYIRYRIPVKAGKTYYLGGRGTKNGFVGVQMEILDANYDNLTYRRADNPDLTDNSQNGPVVDWNFNLASIVKDYDYTSSIETYDDLKVCTIDGTTTYTEMDDDASKLMSSKWNTSDEDFWWTYDEFLKWQGDNPNVGTTINVKLKRTFEAGKWYPIVLPFSVSETKMKHIFGENVQVLYLDPLGHNMVGGSGGDYRSTYRPAISNGSTQLNFTHHFYQMLYANTPAFICPSDTPEPDSDGYITFEHVNYAGGTVKTYDIGGGYEITGSYLPTHNTTDMYYISNKTVGTENVATVYHAPNGIDMKGTRVWIQKKAGSNAAPLRTVGFNTFDGEEYDNNAEAGIEDIVMDDTVIDMYNDDNVYDMLGRVIANGSTAGLPKGVYIFRGQKLYIR